MYWFAGICVVGFGMASVFSFVLLFAGLVVDVGFCLVVLMLLFAIDYGFGGLVDCCFRLRVLWRC